MPDLLPDHPEHVGYEDVIADLEEENDPSLDDVRVHGASCGQESSAVSRPSFHRRRRTCLDNSLINRLLKIFDFLPGSQDVKVFTTFGALYEATPIIVALLDVLNQLSSLVGCHGPSIFALPSQSL